MRIVKLPKGRYVVAVSGGVDSMVLLDMLRRDSGLELYIAHVNHGIRDDVAEDEALVANYAMSHNIPFESTKLYLGRQASEAVARQARYNFLRQCSEKHQADFIVTAHHQDDMIETVLINLLRGTGWRGIAPLTASPGIIRPLLSYTKDELLGYARRFNVPWREDTTNTDERYLRNYVRRSLVPYMDQKSGTWRQTLLQLIRKQQLVRRQIESKIEDYGITRPHTNKAVLRRHQLIMQEPSVALELLYLAVRSVSGGSLQHPLAQKALLFAKAARVGKVMPLTLGWRLRATRHELIVEPVPPVVS